MVEDTKNTTKKKTLSLKLGSSIKSNPTRSFESGSTVIVERKRARKNILSTRSPQEPRKTPASALQRSRKNPARILQDTARIPQGSDKGSQSIA